MIKRASADEVQSKRQGHLHNTASGLAISKAFKSPPSWDKNARSCRFVMSRQVEDRYGDIVMIDGIRTDDFDKNPVALLHHQSREWPIGQWANLEKVLTGRPPRLEGDLILLPKGGPGDAGERVDEAEFMLSNGAIRACSIGFVPDWDNVEYILDEEGKPTYGYRFGASELVECSICTIPANAGALAKMAGDDQRLAKELIEEALDNWSKSPEGKLLSRADFEAQYQITKRAAIATKVAGGEAPETVSWPDMKALPVEEFDLTKVPIDKMNELRALAIKDGKAAADAALAAFVAAKDAGEGDDEDDEDEEHPPMMEDDASKSAEPAATPPAAAPEEAKSITVSINVDTREAEEKIERVSGLMDGLMERVRKLFGGEPKSNEERREPTLETPPAPVQKAQATAEEVAAIKARAEAVRQRLAKV